MKAFNFNTILIIVVSLVFIFYPNKTKVDDSVLVSEIKILEDKIDSINNEHIIINIKALENEIQNFNIDSIIRINNRDSLRSVYNPR